MIIKGWKVRERKVKENDVGMESEGEKSGKKKMMFLVVWLR